MWKPHEMRRKDKAMTKEEAMALLDEALWGVLATADEAGVPVGTPMSHVVMDGGIYFHCAKVGQKVENIAAQPRVCYTVVGTAQPVYDNDFSIFFASAMAHGTARVVEDDAEKRRALVALCEKNLPDYMQHAEADIARAFAATRIIRIDIEHISGKAKLTP